MSLTTFWFLTIAFLWIGYFTIEGFDFGVGMIIKALGRDERERRAMMGAIGPHWDGNEVWLVTAGAAMFAVFPEWYATLFSGAYLALLLIVVGLIVRVCAIEWRGKINSPRWHNAWDWAHTLSTLIPALLWGVAFANMVRGMKVEVVETATGAPVDPAHVPADSLMRGAAHQITGGFFDLVTPFTLLGGVMICLLFITHGAMFVALKTAGDFSRRAESFAARSGIASALVSLIWGAWAQAAYSPNGAGWLVLAVAIGSLAATLVMAHRGRQGWAFGLHFAAIAAVTALIFVAMAPDVMRSSINSAYSLTITQAAAERTTLILCTVVAILLIPTVIAYTVWAYHVLSKRINVEAIDPAAGGLHPTKVRDSSLPEPAAY